MDSPVALITGAARRIGAAIARTLHSQGWRVALHYRGSRQHADALAAELNQQRADSACCLQADLLDTAALPGLVAAAAARWGRLDRKGCKNPQAFSVRAHRKKIIDLFGFADWR